MAPHLPPSQIPSGPPLPHGTLLNNPALSQPLFPANLPTNLPRRTAEVEAAQPPPQHPPEEAEEDPSPFTASAVV